MGLDQFAYKTKVKPDSQVDFEIEDSEEIHYWRKHPNLQGWMENLYYEKGGSKESFNCTAVELTQEDIDALAASILEGDLPDTDGFFFGTSTGEEESDDLEFCKQATQAISEGYTVFYDSWW